MYSIELEVNERLMTVSYMRTNKRMAPQHETMK